MRSHRSWPSRVTKRRSCLRLVRRAGAFSMLPRTGLVTKRCSRRCRVGARLSLLRKPLFGGKRSSTRCARPVPTMEAVCKDGESRHPHGSLSRPPVAIRTSGTGATATCPSFSWVVKVTRGSRRFVVVCLDRAPARPAGVSEEPSFRKGRAHDRIAVAEVGRTASSSWTLAATGDRGYVTKRNAARGNPRGASERPTDGRRSGSSVLAGTVTGSRERVVLAARSQTPPHSGERGSPHAGESQVRASVRCTRVGGTG